MPLSENSRGAAFMAVATVGFALNDALLKVTFETMPISQGVFFRSLFASLFMLPLAFYTHAFRFRPGRKDKIALAVRTMGEIGATVFFMIGLSKISLADATAVVQVTPLAVTMAAALFLGEPVGWRRWSAIGVGFIGVIIMIRPGAEGGIGSAVIYPIISVCFVVLRDIATRQLSRDTPSLYASLLTSACVGLIALMVSFMEGWRAVSLETMGLYSGSAFAIMVGYVCMVVAMRTGDIASVSPFRYTVLMWAFIFGYLIFGDIPDLLTIVGALIVAAAGLYTLWRETVLGRRVTLTSTNRPFAPVEGASLEAPSKGEKEDA
ncbi:DMT family transporter [Acuticoccus sp. M5D2P5]|uniref:DMT family transporter n=1 Tax=Acuticoccus kalidii TaxID=2910977 RepID=UPI001F37C330|nr:DMT family transporter [Acuticoccus kalidii]MCF3933974.1 DMT family transporter [Acuticoccus kalidii]